MADKKKPLPPILWVLSGVFYFAVILLAIAELPDIDIPSTTTTTSSTVTTDTEVVGKININTATVAELCALPGIGEVLAERIVEYRQEHGAFTDIEQLKQVSGIVEKKFEVLRDLIVVQ